jgi:hypothetical protein
VAEIKQLREGEGLAFAEIAARLGLAVSTVYGYYSDPTGERERARRERYRRPCKNPDCGNLTSGADGPGAPPRYCPRCAALTRRRWTEEKVLEAIREWHRSTGAPPTLHDWSPAHAPEGHSGAARYLSEPGRWPSVPQVRARFGSFRAAVRAAGLDPARSGAPRRWTAEEIVAALCKHAARHGAPPAGGDWAHAGGDHPARSTVYRVMGSWRRALEAAGLAANSPSRRPAA